jgi:c-di-GMP-binding flagellar brake protein YcgR
VALDAPIRLSMDEARRDAREGTRVPFRERVRVSGPGLDLDCRGLDLSVAGIGVELSSIVPWPLGESVDVRFQLPNGEPLELGGWVVRRFEHLRHLECWREQGVGIAFEKVEPEIREAIARFVSERLEL